jgi:hypothetical protein
VIAIVSPSSDQVGAVARRLHGCGALGIYGMLIATGLSPADSRPRGGSAMNIWLWIVLVGLLAGGAVAQADYNYEPGQNRLGIFTSDTLPGGVVWEWALLEPLLNITYTPGEQFSVYIMVCRTTQPY